MISTDTALTVLRASAFGYAVSLAALCTRQCGTLGEENRGPLQPPAWVFRVVWPLLYVTTGFAWARAGARGDVPLGVVTAFCCGWLVVYVCLKRRAVAALILAIVTGVTIFAAATLQGVEGGMLIPLSAWLAFATFLNGYPLVMGS